MKRQGDIVVTGAGAATAGAYGLEAHWALLKTGAAKADSAAYSMRDFKPAPYLSDKRMLKAVSSVDAIGLAALEGLRLHMELPAGTYDSERIGLYVGAPPASTFDNEAYVDAMEASRGGSGPASLRAFGKTCMSARPVTLLVGLPNNVLCYGAMLLDARGPNSNYTSSSLSGHLAVINAARRLKRGALDLAVAGGFSAHTEPVHAHAYAALGVARKNAEATDGTVLADGGAFVALERRAAAETRGARILATYLGGAQTSDALGPLTADESGEALWACITRALVEAEVGPDSIGLVLANATGLGRLDVSELSVLSRVFANEREFPALGNSTGILGNLMEAGGVLELGLLPYLYADGEVPSAMHAGASKAGFSRHIAQDKPHALILRTSPWGEFSCIVARQGAP